MSNNNRNFNDLTDGLSPAISMNKNLEGYIDTLQGISTKMVEFIASTYSLPEIDNIIITPIVSRNNDTGVSDLIVKLFFDVKGSSNIFYRGKGNQRQNHGGRISMVDTAGVASSGTGPFGTSDHFREVIKPLCKINERGNADMKIKSQSGANGIATIEVDTEKFFMLLMGIKSNDPYDYSILYVTPISNTNNFSIGIIKFLANVTKNKGKKSGTNYSRIAQEQFNNYNSGNKQGGRRQY